jgi:hypothetical protein
MMNGGGGQYAIAACLLLCLCHEKELAWVGDRGFQNYTQSMVHHHTSYAIPNEMRLSYFSTVCIQTVCPSHVPKTQNTLRIYKFFLVGCQGVVVSFAGLSLFVVVLSSPVRTLPWYSPAALHATS